MILFGFIFASLEIILIANYVRNLTISEGYFLSNLTLFFSLVFCTFLYRLGYKMAHF